MNNGQLEPAPPNVADMTPFQAGDAGEASHDAENEGEEVETDIPQDSFSMLYVAKSCPEHALPFGVFFMQILILVLVAYDLMQTVDRPRDIYMNIPVGVTIS